MNKRKMYFLIVLLISSLFTSCGVDCVINPDLTSDLLAPASDIITGEPVDWDYVVTSVRDNSQDCDIINAIASVGKIAIDFFSDESDPTGELLLENTNNINGLSAGDSQTAQNTISVFNDEGIYMLTVNADDTNVVEERNEDNNFDDAELDTRAVDQSDIFANASPEFKEKLKKAAALVIVGQKMSFGNQFKGKPIYYAK